MRDDTSGSGPDALRHGAMLFLGMLAIAPIAAAQSTLVAHDIPSATSFAPSQGERAFAVGGVWCNAGADPLSWIATDERHPVTGTNLLRVDDGRLVQIGASWAWHHACPLQTSLCGACTPEPGFCPSSLGVGCSTTSTASALGQQSQLGPRSQIDASVVVFPFPFSAPPASGTLARRCRVALADLDPALHADAAYAFQTVTLHADSNDAASVVRRVQTQPLTTTGSVLFAAPAASGASAIDFWHAVHEDVAIVDIALDGLVRVGARVVAVDGGWRYEFAIENIDAHEAIAAFSVPLRGASAGELRFDAPLPHSGEVTSGEPWDASVGDAIAWSTTSFAKDPLANAIRWGTVYSFGFTSGRPPAPALATLLTFRNGQSIEISLPAPAAVGDLDLDGAVGPADLASLLGAWGRCDACPEDLDGDGAVGASDLAIVLGNWTN